jgi:hypothetical protein
MRLCPRLLILLAVSGIAVASPSSHDRESVKTIGGKAIVWQKDLKTAQQLAIEQNRLVLIALNMDGERANDRMVDKVYQDKTVLSLTEKSINLICSRFEHTRTGTCKRFGSVSCEEHQLSDKAMRLEVLKLPADTALVAPQHIFLAPDGKILFSVAYEITVKQLQWCLVTAINKVDPDAKISMPAGAKAPRRLVMDGVAPTDGGDTSILPLSEEEVLETIKFIKAGAKGRERVDAIRSMLGTDDPEAVQFLEVELGNFRYEKRADQLIRLLNAVGGASPPSFWDTIDHFLKSSDGEFRLLTAAALEQLAAPDSVKTLKSIFAKEKSGKVRKNLLRALGVAGAEDKSARSVVLKAWKNKKEPLLRTNALLVLGLHAKDKKARAALLEALQGSNPIHRQAAALGIAFGRDESLMDLLEGALSAEEDKTTKAVMEKCKSVLQGSSLSTIGEDFSRVGEDSHPRPRFFGTVE